MSDCQGSGSIWCRCAGCEAWADLIVFGTGGPGPHGELVANLPKMPVKPMRGNPPKPSAMPKTPAGHPKMPKMPAMPTMPKMPK